MSTFNLRPSSISLFDTMGTAYSLLLRPRATENKVLWSLHIKIEETGEEGVLITSRGETRLFKDVNTAVELVKKYSHKFPSLELSFNNAE